MASPSKCQHGLTTNTCTHCMTDELIQNKKGGFLHIRPDGSMELIKDGLLPDPSGWNEKWNRIADPFGPPHPPEDDEDDG